jgi:sirohydrochlorin ferrochelatase
MLKRSVVLVAHGSRREASNEEVYRLAKQLAALAGPMFAAVDCGFLEIARPSIPEALFNCIANGSRDIIVLPYFLSQGRHVAEDIPAQIALVTAQHPHIKISIAPYLGSSPLIGTVLLSLLVG